VRDSYKSVHLFSSYSYKFNFTYPPHACTLGVIVIICLSVCNNIVQNTLDYFGLIL